MASAAVEIFPLSPVPVDLETLLQPISDERPCGDALRYEGTYDKILDARRSERSDLPQGVWKTDLKQAEWDLVEELCTEALTTRTKDIQIALWLTEAWLNRWGAGGFRHGLELIRRLCETYWTDLHPEIRDGDVEYRVAPFVWLSENLSLGLNAVPMTWPRSYDDLPRCTYADWQGAARLEKMQSQAPETWEQEIANGRLTQERFTATAVDSVPEVAVDVYGQFRACLVELVAVDDVLDKACGREAPSFRKPKNLLRDIIGVCEQVVLPAMGLSAKTIKLHGLPSKAAAPTVVPDEDTDSTHFFADGDDDVESEPNMIDPATVSASTDRISGRAQAYRTISEVATYLQRVEPHSPTPYLLRRIVAWENKTLLELMQELLQNPAEVQALYQFLGMPFNRYDE